MRVKSILEVCTGLLRKKSAKNPDGCIKVDGEAIIYDVAANEIEKLCKWIYPDLSTYDIEKVVHCINCAHYKRYTKKGHKEKRMLCELDHKQKRPAFFCAEGKERKDVQ